MRLRYGKNSRKKTTTRREQLSIFAGSYYANPPLKWCTPALRKCRSNTTTVVRVDCTYVCTVGIWTN